MSKVTLTDAQAGYKITSVINDNNATLEQFSDETITRDGSTAMASALDMDGHKLLNVAAGTSAADAVNKAQLDTLGQNLPQTVIDQIATRVAAIIGDGVTPPGGYTNPPAPTTLVTSGVTYANVTLTWTMSSTTWAEGYYIYRNGVFLATVRSAATLTYSDTTVFPLSSYVYSISSFNESYGYESARTSATTVTTPADTTIVSPGTPTSVVLSEPIANQGVQINWQYNSDAPVDTWRIYRGGSLLGGADAATAFGYLDTTVLPATQYSYQVSGVNQGFGEGTKSTAVSITTAAQVSATPPAPTSVAVTALSSTSLRVTWAYSSDLHDGFQVDVVGPNTFTYTNAAIGKATRAFTVTGLQPSTTYSVTISAIKFTSGGEWDRYSATAVTGTTTAGTTTSPLTLVTPATTSGQTEIYTGVLGTGITSVPDFTATGGVAPYTWSSLSFLPNGLSISNASNVGAIVGSPTGAAAAGSSSATIQCADAVGNKVTFELRLYIDTTALILTPPASIASNLIAVEDSAYASGNWTASGGLAPYALDIAGALPAGITETVGATTCSINGTGTSSVGVQYPFTVSVTDSSPTPKSVSTDYVLDYRATAAVNRAPVVRAQGTFAQVFNITSGTASATVLDGDNIFFDPDGDDLDYEIQIYAQGDVDPIPDISTYGFTFNAETGVLSYDGDTITPQTLAVVLTADDAQDIPLSLSYNFTLTPTKSAAFPGLATAGFVASGGDGTYTYSWVSGSIPTWLASNSSTTSINSSTGLFVGGTGNVGTNATYGPYVFRVTDGTAATADVSVTFTTQDALVDGFVSERVPGSYYATNFTGVYVNGVLARTITAVNDLGDYTNASGNVANDSGTLWGEANGGTQFPNHIDWVTDPTGLQAKVAKFVNLPTDSTSSGGFVKCIDGRQSGTVNGPNYSKFYYQVVFYADRNVFGYRYASSGDMKIMYVGGSQESGQIVIATHLHTGFYHMYVDGSFGSTNSRTDPTGITKTPYPNPWNNTSLANYQIRPGLTYPASSAGKIAWYEAAGYLKWSSAGLTGDLGASLGSTYPSTADSSVNTKYLDERTHTIAGVDVGWPAAPVITGGAGYVHLNAWNVIQICVEYKPYDAVTNPQTLSSFAMWTAKYGDPPVLRMAMIDKMYINATGQNAVWIGGYDTGRTAETDRPTGNTLYKEIVVSPNRIPFPGGILPTLPAGLTG